MFLLPHPRLAHAHFISLFALALIGLVLGGFVLFWPLTPAEPSPQLRVVTPDGEELLRIPLDQGLSWEIHWQHSVAGILVRDGYRWQDGQMLLTDSWTPLLDVAGLGYTPGRGELRVDEAGDFWIAEINEAVPGNVHRIRIGSGHAPTTLIYADRAYPLSLNHPSLLAHIEVILP
jgi:hypothetical protein